MKRLLFIISLYSLCFNETILAQTNSKDFQMPGTFKFEVPKGITTLTVSLWGAGGWGGGDKGYGGKGGFVSGSVIVKEGEILLLTVAQNGARERSAGITCIKRDTTYIALAAGGGNGCAYGGRGGDGGPSGRGGSLGSGTFLSGNSGSGAGITNGGTGGSSKTGSAGKNGSLLKGGTNDAKAPGEGWGGDGWYGGGAAGTFNSTFLSGDPYAAGGGGGGSNSVKGLTGIVVNSSNGNAGGTGNNMGYYGRILLNWK
jgi:trimeric autotransporter adhesin